MSDISDGRLGRIEAANRRRRDEGKAPIRAKGASSMQRAGATPAARRAGKAIAHNLDVRRRLIAAIHTRAKALGMAEPDRRELQERLTGRRSCADMTLPQLRKVAEDLRLAELRLHPRPVDATRPADARHRMRERARAIARTIGVDSDAYLDAIARRQSGVAFADADPQQLRGVIAALYRRAKRLGHDVA